MPHAMAVALMGALCAGQAVGEAPVPTAEVFQVTPDRIGDLPQGERADGTAGDWVLRNDKVVAVLAGVKADRAHAADVAPGTLLDFTYVLRPNDQLTAFLAGGDRRPASRIRAAAGDNGEAVLVVEREADPRTGLLVTHSFSLARGDRWLKLTTLLRNPTDEPIEYGVFDAVRCEGFQTQPDGYDASFWCWDRPNRCAYGLLHLFSGVATMRKGDVSEVCYPAVLFANVAPGATFRVSRYLLVGESPADLHGQCERLKGRKVALLRGIVSDEDGKPLRDVPVLIKRELFETTALTNSVGGFSVGLEYPGKVVMYVSAEGRPPTKAIAWIRPGINERVEITVPSAP